MTQTTRTRELVYIYYSEAHIDATLSTYNYLGYRNCWTFGIFSRPIYDVFIHEPVIREIPPELRLEAIIKAWQI